MRVSAVEVRIDLGDEISFLHRVGRIALKHGAGADPAAVAFQVAIGSIGADFLEIGAESVTRQNQF